MESLRPQSGQPPINTLPSHDASPPSSGTEAASRATSSPVEGTPEKMKNQSLFERGKKALIAIDKHFQKHPYQKLALKCLGCAVMAGVFSGAMLASMGSASLLVPIVIGIAAAITAYACSDPYSKSSDQDNNVRENAMNALGNPPGEPETESAANRALNAHSEGESLAQIAEEGGLQIHNQHVTNEQSEAAPQKAKVEVMKAGGVKKSDPELKKQLLDAAKSLAGEIGKLSEEVKKGEVSMKETEITGADSTEQVSNKNFDTLMKFWKDIESKGRDQIKSQNEAQNRITLTAST